MLTLLNQSMRKYFTKIIFTYSVLYAAANQNMDSLKKILFFISLLFTVCFSPAQQNNNGNPLETFRAVHWGLDEGLSQGETYHMIKDVNGFLWIGTRYGLNRFDGNSFKVYTNEHNNNKSLITNDVRAGLIEDSMHNIWIGSNQGISRYNINTEDFTNFFPDTTLKNGFSGFAPFWATKNEVFCMEGESEITAYNIHSLAKRMLVNLGEYKNKTIGISDAYSIFDSSTNSIWCLAENPEGKAGLLQIMLSTKQTFFFAFQYHRKKSSQNLAEDLCYDTTRKCIWINSTEGLLQFTLNDKQFHHVNALFKYEQAKDYTRFVGIALDKQGRVWFATDPKGIIIYNPADESVSLPFRSDSAMQNEISFANACIYYDRDNIMWSGFWLRKGIYEILPFNPVVKHYTSNQKKDSLNGYPVTRAKDAGAGKLWVNTHMGVFVLNSETGVFHRLQKKDFPGIKTGNGIISVVAIDTLVKKTWLMTDSGFFKEDIVTKNCTPILFKTSDNRLITRTGIPTFDGKEIFFTRTDNNSQHVCFINLNSDTGHEILSFPGSPFNKLYTVPVENHFLFLQGNTDEKNNRTYENKNGKWVLIHTPVDSMRWTSIAYIKESKTYWVAGEKQLFHFDNSFHILQKYSTENGLPELPIVGLINDTNGNIWFHTDRSILELNTATGQVKTMSGPDGFEKENFELLPFADKDANGNIYYGGGVFGTGLDKISPGNSTSTVSSVYLKSLTINQKPFPLKASINYTDTLSLKYNQTKIEIETGIIDFYSQGKSRLRYKLEGKGIDESWHYAPYYYLIRYDGLQPGNYELRMQASNASNEFNGPVKILFINISPAFWDTWWFRIIAGVCAVALIYGLMRWKVHQKFRLRLQQAEREKQLAELKDKTSQLEMETLRAQMNPHFIFNCLSSINRFILKNKTEEASDYLTKFSRLIRMVLNNSKREYISLEDELETLRLYLEMERLRFKNSFDYSFTCQKAADIDNIFIPPLLLQPFAENAIWHGLMHKQDKGFLNLNFSTEEKFLLCTITDNGVGREKAELLKSKSAEKQKSMGLKITTERLGILNNNSNEQTFFSIEDLTDENGNAIGTRVHLKIYYKEMVEI